MSANHPPQSGDPIEATTRCAGPGDIEALRTLRDEVFALVGAPCGFGVLYGSGFREGMLRGMRLSRGFQGLAPPSPYPTGPGIPLLPCPEAEAPAVRFSGALARSPEATLPAADVAPEAQPGCVVSAGFAAGWYSALLGEQLLVREVECVTRGDAGCRFEASSPGDWAGLDPAWIEQLLPFLDFDKIQQRAAAELEQLEDEKLERNEASHFDPLTPAAHVWGPLLVLPYAGVEDAHSTLDAIWRDPVSERIEVAVVDVTGAKLDEVETVGLVQLLATFEECGIEAILAGLQPEAATLLRSASSELAEPLMAHGVSEAIALGFQMCRPSGSLH